MTASEETVEEEKLLEDKSNWTSYLPGRPKTWGWKLRKPKEWRKKIKFPPGTGQMRMAFPHTEKTNGGGRTFWRKD